MKNQACSTAIEAAKNEGRIEAGELMSEIQPVLKDFFVGKISMGGDGIIYKMPSGQTFLISAREIG